VVAAQAVEVPAVTAQASTAFQAAVAASAQAAGALPKLMRYSWYTGFLCPPPALPPHFAHSFNIPAIILGDFKRKDCWCY
jgi:hypothetical protein